MIVDVDSRGCSSRRSFLAGSSCGQQVYVDVGVLVLVVVDRDVGGIVKGGPRPRRMPVYSAPNAHRRTDMFGQFPSVASSNTFTDRGQLFRSRITFRPMVLELQTRTIWVHFPTTSAAAYDLLGHFAGISTPTLQFCGIDIRPRSIKRAYLNKLREGIVRVEANARAQRGARREIEPRLIIQG